MRKPKAVKGKKMREKDYEKEALPPLCIDGKFRKRETEAGKIIKGAPPRSIDPYCEWKFQSRFLPRGICNASQYIKNFNLCVYHVKSHCSLGIDLFCILILMHYYICKEKLVLISISYQPRSCIYEPHICFIIFF